MRKAEIVVGRVSTRLRLTKIATVVNHKVLQVVVEARVLGKPIIMESDKVQSIFLHGDFVKTRLF